MSFKSFPVYRLEELIGEQTLQKVAAILPAFDSTIDTDSIYTKDNLVKVIYSFFDSDNFLSNKLRTEFLSYQTEGKLNDFCEHIDVSKNLSFDEKIRQIISKGWSKPDFCKAFCDYFDLPQKFIPLVKVEYPNFELLPKCETPFKVLKEYQAPICYKAIRNLEYRNKRFILQMPTGSGKTRTTMEIITDSFNRAKEGCLIFWLVYSEELCEQAVECFEEIWKHVGNKKVKLIRAWGRNNLFLKDVDKFSFVVGGFQKLYVQLQKSPELFENLKDMTFLIVVDEAHRVLAPTYKAVTDSLFGMNCRLIGLTATPGRGINNKDENKRLSEYFNEEKLDIDTPNGKTVFSYLKSIGVMAYANFQPLVTSPTYSLSSRDIRYLEENFDFPPAFVKKIGEDETRNFEIINELIVKLKTHRKALFFGCSVEHSKFICSMLNYLGIKAAHVDGTTNRGTRQSILNEYKKGELQIICNFGILSTGFDAPKTDLVFIARPTHSIVLYSQMIGRGLRGKEVGGTENCTIVTVKDNIAGLPNESNIFTYFDEYFEN
jgi:superfamily II DNA or RNA helicase